jgi:hypothetical protein
MSCTKVEEKKKTSLELFQRFCVRLYVGVGVDATQRNAFGLKKHTHITRALSCAYTPNK